MKYNDTAKLNRQMFHIDKFKPLKKYYCVSDHLQVTI